MNAIATRLRDGFGIGVSLLDKLIEWRSPKTLFVPPSTTTTALSVADKKHVGEIVSGQNSEGTMAGGAYGGSVLASAFGAISANTGVVVDIVPSGTEV